MERAYKKIKEIEEWQQETQIELIFTLSPLKMKNKRFNKLIHTDKQ